MSLREICRKLWQEHMKNYTGLMFKAVLCMIVAAMATAAMAYLLKPVFDKVFGGNNLADLYLVCGAVFGVFVIKGLATYGENITLSYLGNRIIVDLQQRLFAHLIKIDLLALQKYTSGELISHFTNDVQLMRAAVSNTIIGIGKDFFTLLFLVVLMFVQDWVLAILALVVFPLTIGPLLRIGRRMYKVTDQSQFLLARFTSTLNQLFQGIRLIKAYATEEHEIKRINKLSEEVLAKIYKANRVRAYNHPVVESLGGLAMALVISYGGYQVIQHQNSVGAFVSFLGALFLIYEPIKRLGNLNNNLNEGLAAAKRIFVILELKPSIVSPENPKIIENFKGVIEFHNVSFSYNDDKEALRNINFTIQPGQTVAFVGPSGSGKTTLVNLLSRFYDPTGGSITLDGIDLRQLSLDFLHEKIAMVGQESTLFTLSIKENIAYGNTIHLAEIKEASVAANADSFINELPKGYETILPEGGNSLSGGQRQRLNIARALYKQSPILVLDEATSALDNQVEKYVQEAIWKRAHTMIVIAHRLSTIQHADCIYVLDHGKIVESGVHEMLMQKGGLYATLWQAQSWHFA